MGLSRTLMMDQKAMKRLSRLSPQVVHCCLCLLLTAVVFLPMLLSAGDFNARRTDFPSTISFLAIGAVVLGNLFYASYRRPFSVNVSHWTFMLIFFFIAPFVQYLTGHIPGQADPIIANGPADILDQYRLKANLCILGWCFAYMFVYYRIAARMGGPEDQPEKRVERVNVVVLGIFSVLVLGVIFAFLGSALFKTRGAQSDADGLAAASSAGLNLIVGTAVKGIPFLTLVLLLFIRRTTAAYYPVLVLVLGIVILFNNPISNARFVFGATALSFLCLFLRRKRISALWIPLTLLISFFTILPVLNAARSKTVAEGTAGISLNGYTAQLQGGDYDAYAMTLDAINYVDAGPGVRSGLGLGSAVLFLVPRDAWPDRSKGSGSDLAEYYGFTFKGLSCPIPAEGYLDFGVPGLIGYAMLFAAYVGLVDRAFWRLSGLNSSLAFTIVYPVLIGNTIILLRGSLHPILAFTSTVIPSAIVVVMVSRIGVRWRSRPIDIL